VEISNLMLPECILCGMRSGYKRALSATRGRRSNYEWTKPYGNLVIHAVVTFV